MDWSYKTMISPPTSTAYGIQISSSASTRDKASAIDAVERAVRRLGPLAGRVDARMLQQQHRVGCRAVRDGLVDRRCSARAVS